MKTSTTARGGRSGLVYAFALTLIACSPGADESPPVSPADSQAARDKAPMVGPRELGSTAFVGATVIPMDSESILENQTVIVRDGRIVSVSPAADAEVTRRMTGVDASGN